MAQPARPSSRRSFEIVIICALPIEADAVVTLFDEYWDDEDGSIPYDKSDGDPNAYSTGRIGRHDVVVAHMPDMGGTNAAAAAASCRSSWPGIKLALVVGVCGAVPFAPSSASSSSDEIILGDVIISDGLIQYDLGRRYPEQFIRKDTLLESLGRPSTEIRALVAKLKVFRARQGLLDKMRSHLDELQKEPQLKAQYPGARNDWLFDPKYRHQEDGKTCDKCGCDGERVRRTRLLGENPPRPAVHFGLIASGNTVMKSGGDRDRMSEKEGIIGFEMEGAGVWDTFPCIVIKGVCDYADSHKTKVWQRYAAATAAACSKAFLEYWVPSQQGRQGDDAAESVMALARRRSETSIPIPHLVQAYAMIPSLIVQSGASNSMPGYQAIADPSLVLPTFLRSFNHFNYRNALEEISQSRYPGTCDWIFDTAEMDWWCQGQQSRLLWFIGHPGIGKSTLAAHLVQTLQSPRKESGHNSTVLYGFCNEQKNYTASMVLSTLIHQILMRLPALHGFAFDADRWDCLEGSASSSNIIKGKHRSASILWQLLQTLIRNSKLEKIFIIIDALDVFQEAMREVLINLLSREFETANASKNTPIKIFITSQPGDIISRMQSQWDSRYPGTSKQMTAFDHEARIHGDVDRFVQSETKRIQVRRGYSAAEMASVKEQLANDEAKSFLKVTLYFKRLEESPASTLQDVLDGVSEDLGTFYIQLLSKLPHYLRSNPSPLMTFIAYSFRSLSFEELAFATWWEEKGKDGIKEFRADLENPLAEDDMNRARRRVEMYHPVLKVRPNGSVCFYHDTIRHFVTERSAIPGGDEFLVLDEKAAHMSLALMCIRTMTLKCHIPLRPYYKTGYMSNQVILSAHVFLSYAMQFWHMHLRKAIPSDTPPHEIDKELLVAVRDLVLIWADSETTEYRKYILSFMRMEQSLLHQTGELTPLEVLSCLGLDPFLRAYLQLNNSNYHAENAVRLAIEAGHEGALAILLEAFDINSLEGKKFDTTLSASVRSGRPEMVKKVLQMRRSRTRELTGALHDAFMRGERRSVEYLAEDESIFRDRDHFGMTALHALFAYSRTRTSVREEQHLRTYIAMTEYLIRNGVGVNARDDFGFTALHWVCLDRPLCNRDMIECLVSRGADIHARSLTGLTPLHLAAFRTETVDAVNCLLELGGSSLVGAASHGLMTPMHWAVTRLALDHDYRTSEVMRALLRHGADIRAKNKRGFTPLDMSRQFRATELQEIYAGMEGVDLVQISYFRGRQALIWDSWRDVSSEALVVLEVRQPPDSARIQEVEEDKDGKGEAALSAIPSDHPPQPVDLKVDGPSRQPASDSDTPHVLIWARAVRVKVRRVFRRERER